MFNIILYENNSASDCARKNLQEIATVSVELKGECSVSNPVFVLTANENYINCNYVSCSKFGRDYFASVTIDGNIMIITCKCDVLSTAWWRGLMYTRQNLTRTSDSRYYNLHLVDNQQPMKQNPKTSIYQFSQPEFNIDKATTTSNNFIAIIGGASI